MFSWATGNYPAGAFTWSGTPYQVSPAYTAFTPGQAPAAQEMNYLFSQMATAAVAGVTVPGVSWQTPDVTVGNGLWINTGGINAIVAACYDPTYTRWVIATSNGNVIANYNYVYYSQGYGSQDFTEVDSGAGIAATGSIRAIATDGAHYFAAFVRASDSAAIIYTCTYGGAWVASVTDTSQTYSDAAITITQGNVVVTFSPSGAISNAKSWYTAVGALSFTAGVSGDTFASSAVFQAASPTVMVQFRHAPTDPQYSRSVNGGVSWTPITLPSSITSHSDVYNGLCWSPADGVFVLMSAGGDSKTHTYISADGLTWSEQGTGLTQSPITTGVAANSSGCLVALGDSGGAAFQMYSVDAGATWHWSSLILAAPGYVAVTNPKVAASNTGFFAFTNGHGRFSHNSGLSSLVT